MRYLLILCLFLSGCQTLPKTMNVQILSTKKTLKEVIYKKNKIAVAISLETELSMSQAMLFWENYKSSHYEHFIDYLIGENPGYLRDDIYRYLVGKIKMRLKLL